MTEPPPIRRRAVEALALTLAAAAVRVAAAWTLGEGAPFGPDGTGLQASIVLGGHPYPLHTALLQPFAEVRTLSLLLGSLSPLLLWAWGRRVGLGGGGGWLLAFLPLGIYPSALAAGDAPALFVVLLGALLSTGPPGLAVVGGALALISVAIKPIALPALVLLAVRPVSLAGAALCAPVALKWLDPLVRPRPRGGLLGTWWVSNDGSPPTDPGRALDMLRGGAQALLDAPPWIGTWLVVFACVGAAWPRRGAPTLGPGRRAAVLAPVLGLLATAALFGDRFEARYLAPSLCALLPWVGAVVPRGTSALLLWPALALVTQVAAERERQDPRAEPHTGLVVPTPRVDARVLFDEASTEGATELRQRAMELAETLPPGATVTVERRAHGREGELTWPLAVRRPDVRVEVVDP